MTETEEEILKEIASVEGFARKSKTYEKGMSDEAYNKVRSLAYSLVELGVGKDLASNICRETHLMTAPGSPVTLWFHSNFEGGLAFHSLLVTGELIKLSEMYGAFRDSLESIVKVGMLHDMCKAIYNQPPDDFHKNWWYKRPMYPGHAEASLAIIQSLGINLTEKEIVAIRWHMGAFNQDKDSLKYYDVAKKRYPSEVLCTHWADMAAANFHEWSVKPVEEEEKKSE